MPPPIVPTTFQSTSHPGNAPWGIVYTRFLARPLAVCVIPLMIGATTSALLGKPIWAYLFWGLPFALLLATIWTYFTLDRTIAEVRVRSGQIALRSVYDVLRDRPPNWKPLFNVRTTSWHTELSVGRTTYMLHPNRWPNYEGLKEAALGAFQAGQRSSHA